MKPVLTSNTQPVEEMQEALRLRGFGIGEEEIPATPPAEGEQPSEQPAAPGEPVPGEPKASEIVPAPEAGKDKSQEAKSGEGKSKEEVAGEKPPEPASPSRANFKSKIVKLEERAARLADDLDAERGNSTKLKQQLAEVQAELAKLKPTEKPADELVEPQRPTREGTGWQEEKYEEALAQYDKDLKAYYKGLSERTVAQALEQKEREREERQATIEFEQKRNADSAKFEDWDDVISTLPDDYRLPASVEASIEASDRPALLIHYFALDYHENDGQEAKRIMALDPVRQVREITRLETALIAEFDAPEPASPAAEPPAVPAAAPPPKSPAKPETPPKPKKEEPITPLGSRTSGVAPSLGQAHRFSEYAKLRGQGATR